MGEERQEEASSPWVCVCGGGVPGFGGPKEGGIGEADTFGLSWQPEAGGLYLIPSLES